VPNGLGVEFVLAAEVPIEAAMRQACGSHDLVDRGLGKSSPIEQMSSAAEDPLSRLPFVVVRTASRLLPREAIKIAPRNISHTKDYLEHLLSPTILRRIAKNIFGITAASAVGYSS
jgi:hypothetical protein